MLIRAIASAVNRADTLQRKGAYPPPPGVTSIIGLEVAGIVESIGESVATGVKVGDRVCALLSGGGYAEYAAVDARHIIPVPPHMPLKTAAAIPEAWLTAYQLLHLVGHIKAGDTVLVHAGASGVGIAAIQLVAFAGARAIVTVGSSEKQSELLALGVAAAVNYKEGPWLPAVLAATENKGVDMVLDCIGESYAEQNSDVLKLDGRWVCMLRCLLNSAL